MSTHLVLAVSIFDNRPAALRERFLSQGKPLHKHPASHPLSLSLRPRVPARYSHALPPAASPALQPSRGHCCGGGCCPHSSSLPLRSAVRAQHPAARPLTNPGAQGRRLPAGQNRLREAFTQAEEKLALRRRRVGNTRGSHGQAPPPHQAARTAGITSPRCR